MKLQIVDVALEAVRALRPVLLRIRREDPSLYRQVRDALNSTVLNLSEGEYSDPGTRKARFHNACGSCNEARGGVRAAQAWATSARRRASRAFVISIGSWPRSGSSLTDTRRASPKRAARRRG